MEERTYQMKDLMEKFEITRDTIKYYEKKGLINSQRNKSGYRQYTEVEAHKIRNIQDLKAMGFTLEECELLFSNNASEEQGKVFDAVEKKLKTEIERLEQQLDRIQNYKERGIEDEQCTD